MLSVCLFGIAAQPAARADVRDTHKLVIAHIKKARSIPGLEDATAVLVLESNLA